MKFLIFIVYGFLITSCIKKDETFYISGLVYDSLNNQVVSNAKLSLYAKKIESGVWNNNYSELSTLSTDINGFYSIKVENIKSSDYKIEIEKTNYYFFSKVFQPNTFIKSQNNTLNISMNSIAYVNFKIRNTSPWNNQDLLTFKIKNNPYIDLECCNDTVKYYSGMTVNESYICKSIGNYPLEITWIVKKGTLIKNFSETVYPLAFDTLIYNLNY